MKRLILAPAFLFACAIACGGSSPNVPIDDHVYRDIDRLVAAGLIKDAIYGQRPWSRNEIARMIAQARRSYDEKGGISSDGRNMATAIMAEYMIEQLENEYRDELAGKSATSFHWLDEVSGEAVLLDSPYRPVPGQNGLGQIKASVNPLISYREGRHYADGGTFAVESVHWVKSAKYFSAYLRPRFEVLIPADGSSDVDVHFQKAYGKFTLKNLEFEAGRDSLVWGPGEYGGVLASDNTRNIDMIKISNDSPFLHPWIFKYLGKSKYTFFAGSLGEKSIYKNAYVYGLAASYKPLPSLEFGFEHQVTTAGDGAPGVNFADLVKEFFLYRDYDIYEQDLADHRVGFNFRARISRLHNSELYVQGIFEDYGKQSFWPQFTEWMGFLSGIYFPLFTKDGANDLRIEYEHLPASYGRHGMWASGLSLDDVLRGSEIGPDGHGVHITWGHRFSSGVQLKSAAHYEYRDSDIYTTTPSDVGGPDRVVSIVDNPSEERIRFTADFDWPLRNGFVLRPKFGYEHVRSFDFVPGDHKNNFLGALSLHWFPGF